jgi:hypothetical protein
VIKQNTLTEVFRRNTQLLQVTVGTLSSVGHGHFTLSHLKSIIQDPSLLSLNSLLLILAATSSCATQTVHTGKYIYIRMYRTI